MLVDIFTSRHYPAFVAVAAPLSSNTLCRGPVLHHFNQPRVHRRPHHLTRHHRRIPACKLADAHPPHRTTPILPPSAAAPLLDDSPVPLYPLCDGSPSLWRILPSLWRFSRPHTVYGTVLSIFSVSTLAVQHHALPLLSVHTLLAPLLAALIPALLLNVYIVGLNQLHDIPIDRVNKPYLPLPAGDMTLPDARATVFVSLLGGLAFCAHPLATPALKAVLSLSAVLGTLYSMPPFRLKRFALLASMAILTVRGLLVNVGFYLHMAASASASATASTLSSYPTIALRNLPAPIAFAAAFFTVFGVVIALLKDVPDIKGDRLFGIRTFSVTVGARTIFRLCVLTLCLMFLTAGAFYFRAARTLLPRVAVTVAHILMAGLLAMRARTVDPAEATQVADFYMLSWKAFYAEYLLLPLIGL